MDRARLVIGFFVIVDGQVNKIDQRGILIEASSTISTAVAENIAHRHGGSLVPLDCVRAPVLSCHDLEVERDTEGMGWCSEAGGRRE